MINRLKTSAAVLISFSLISVGTLVRSQENTTSDKNFSTDSLSLKSIIEVIVRDHPTVKSAEEAIKNADARIALARTGYYPQIDLSADYTNIGPVIQLTIPQYGTFKLYPNNNYSSAVNYSQVVYDFGRTRQNIEIEKENKKIGEQTLDQVRQNMSLSAVNGFYSIAYLQEAVRIKNEQLAALDTHLMYVETMKATGAATDYQILSTRVRISTAESQKVDLLTALDVQRVYLSALIGNDGQKPVVKKELIISAPETGTDSLLRFAFLNRSEVLLRQEMAMLAGLRFQFIKTLNKPVVSFFASGGFKNGYIPDLNVLKANYTVGVGFSVPLFDGMKTRYNLLQAQSAITSANFESEATKRNISSEVKEAEAYMNSAFQKISHFKLQLEQAIKAYSLAETSFRSGTITNLELLDANTEVSESKLMLLKAKIDYAASIYRFKATLGEKLY